MMKKYIYYICLLSLLGWFTSCHSDNQSGESIFNDNTSENNAFDSWLYTSFTKPYNINLLYHLKNTEINNTYTLAPADYEKSVKLAHIILYAWIGAYNEVASLDFTRKYVPRVIQLVGSEAFNPNGTTSQGSSDNGVKITLYNVNNLSLQSAFLQENYIKTMHREFIHVLTQKMAYDKDFDKISAASYVTTDWYKKTNAQALSAGFITPYAMSEANEDFAETASMYLVSTDEQWTSYMNTAGTNGAAIINEKLKLVETYMKSSWSVDIDLLRSAILQRINDIVAGKVDLTTLN